MIERPELVLGRHAFGADPAGYDAARKNYPAELFERIAARAKPGPLTRAFEIGPGTGKATGPMLGLGLGALTAIEPDARLAAWLRGALPDPRLRLIEANFEAADLMEGGFDLGFAATSFHWLDAPSALARVRVLLRPGGLWAMWWNVYQDPDRRDAFRDAVTPIIQDLRAAAPSFRTEPPAALPQGLIRALNVPARIAELEAAGLREPEAHRLHWDAVFDTAGIQALYGSFSFMREVDPELAKDGLARIGEIAEADFGGQVTRACVTQLYMASRRDA